MKEKAGLPGGPVASGLPAKASVGGIIRTNWRLSGYHDGCHAGGLHTGRPSSAHSVTPLAALLSLSDPVTEAQSDRSRRRETTQETREWVAHPFRYRHS